MKKRVLGYLVSLLVAYLAVLVLMRLFENSFIFFPNMPGRLEGDWKPEGLPVEDVWLRTSDGVKLHAWWIPAPGAEFTFLAFHGNAANIANRADIYRFLHKLPANVLAVEYRGYGRSEGTPSEAGIYRDADAAYDHLTGERRIPAARIVSFGQSLGTSVAVDLAARRAVGGVVLEAPFPSARELVRRVYAFLPGLTWIMRSKFDTRAKLSRIRMPLLVVHCTQDPVIAFSFGEQVFQAAGEPKSFLRVPGWCHEEAALIAPAEYAAALRAFLARL